MAYIKKIVVIGAGLSGLLQAYNLHKKGYFVTLLEKGNEVGGMLQTSLESGFLFDKGFGSGVELSGFFEEIVKDLDFEDNLVFANENARHKYIYKSGEFHPMPTSPESFKKSALFSSNSRFRMFFEKMLPRSKDGYNLSVKDFVIRRLGEEVYEYYFDPVVSEVYCGDPAKLSIKSAFPRLYSLEEEYGSLFGGLTRSAKQFRSSEHPNLGRMFTFKEGMQSFTTKLVNYSEARLFTHAAASEIVKKDSGFEVRYNHAGDFKTIICDAVVSAAPAYSASKYIKNLDDALACKLETVDYVPLLVLMAVFKMRDVEHVKRGFGALIPQKENLPFLSVLYNSFIFDNFSSEDTATFTITAGGAENREIIDRPGDEIKREIINAFSEALKINAIPVVASQKLWKKGIPQFNTGHNEIVDSIKKFEEKNPGIFFTGNYISGVTVGECIKNAELDFKKISGFLE